MEHPVIEKFSEIIPDGFTLGQFDNKVKNKWFQIKNFLWPYGIHFEFIFNELTTCLELHLEDDKVKSLYYLLEIFQKELPSTDIFYNKPFGLDPKWSKGRGKLFLALSNQENPESIASLMKAFIESTTKKINSELERLGLLKKIDLKQFINDFINFADKQEKGVKLEGLKEFNAKYLNLFYMDLQVKYSFGQGVANVTPWIAFLGYNQKPQKGIYPNIHYIKDEKIIRICYGKSNEEKPDFKWSNRSNNETLSEFNSETIIDKFDKFESDLDKIIKEYHLHFQNISNDNYQPKLNLQYPLNQILYGPPGTGKTYNTIDLAIKIIDQDKHNHNDNQKIFKQLLGNQIEFITFHQNYSYEDFIQGLKPSIENSSNSNLSFQLKDGVFKRISDKALDNYKASRANKIYQDELPSFRKVFNEVFKSVIEDNESIEIPMKKTYFKIIGISDKSIYFEKKGGSSSHSLSINTLQKMYENGKNEIIIGGLQPYYNPLLEFFKNGANKLSKIETVEELKNFVIVIDEINRANISRVFGELITLIEEDKRWGKENQMELTLPSGETFTVPPNLYIIGTMNTADKSIALLDIALRRRFDFIPMYPDYSIIPEFADILKPINQKIKDKKGSADFMIGHSFFTGKTRDDLPKIINKKIIPLLNEYFNGKSELVKEVLRAGNIEVIEDENFQLVYEI